MKPSLESILYEAVDFEAEAFNDDRHISGADLMEWFAEWRERAQAIVRSNRPTHHAAIYGQRFRSQLIGALHALQTMQDRAAVERPLMSQLTHSGPYTPPTDAEIEALIFALDNGGIQITSGQFNVVVFKHSAKEPSCKRR